MQSNIELIIKILQKAHENGYRFSVTSSYVSYDVTSYNDETGRIALMLNTEKHPEIIYLNLTVIVHELDFARAFFGEDWETHLNLFPYNKERLKYMSNFIYT